MKAFALVILAALAGTAAADDKDAEKLFHAGEKAYKAQRFLVAAKAFEEAYKQFPAPEIAFSAAQAYRRQYRIDPSKPDYVKNAVRFYQIYIKEQKGGTRLGDAADSLGEMLHELDRLGLNMKDMSTVEETKTELGVSVVFEDRQQQSSAAGMHEVEEAKDKEMEVGAPTVKAFIDGKPVELDGPVEVSPGDHVVRAEAEGYLPAEQNAHAVAKHTRFADITLRPKPARVTVTAEPGATIIVDGRGQGEAPHAPIELAGGSHVIAVTHTGKRPVAHEVVVTRDQQITVPFELEPTKRRRSVRWVLAADGVTVVAAGVFLLGAFHYDQSASKRLALLQSPGDQDHVVLDDYNKFKSRRDTALYFAAGAGTAALAIGLTAAWLYYFDNPSAEGVKVVPLTSSTTAGAAISGRF